MMKRVVLITGGSRGIGAACALVLAQEGVDVAIHYVKQKECAEKIAHRCRFYGVRAITLQADLRSLLAAKKLKEELRQAGFSLNMLIHCAGITHHGLLEETSLQTWEDVLNVNLRSAYLLASELGAEMRWQGWGRLVFFSSIWGQAGGCAEAAYAASKGGLDALTKSLAKELASSSITVNAVSPGIIATKMGTEGLDERNIQEIVSQIPVGRMGSATEVAELVRFLVSSEADYVTGQIVGCNGGWRI